MPVDSSQERYLSLLAQVLTDYVNINIHDGSQFVRPEYAQMDLNDLSVRRAIRAEGGDWPQRAYSMSGLKRLDNLRHCIEQVVADAVPGDVVETGVWRGGACIFAKAVLDVLGAQDRWVWLADSFQGLPAPDFERYPGEFSLDLSTIDYLKAGRAVVEENFRRFGLLDGRVRFIEGWFRDTLPSAPVRSIAILRLDGDLYESTMVALDSLYDRVPSGGYVIVDDHGAVPACADAIRDFRLRRGITDPMMEIDWTGTYWRKG